MVVTEILPSDTYRISQLEPSNGRLYARTAHVSQLKAWKSWMEDDDDSSENSDDEPEMQRPKRNYTNLMNANLEANMKSTVFKPRHTLHSSDRSVLHLLLWSNSIRLIFETSWTVAACVK
ncbi:hypothetical protein AVEN_212364-1 [Araneus ventricosus]|uniref:Uncharacterized protein n=1 Tax=Araneus ventricosus TaxID=182803 RepID=A0A4Y2U567_ARAVE|nr:hypothetical protein AVEN_212364-1 [Araneus ventricosus]